jgi:hypothetical protein
MPNSSKNDIVLVDEPGVVTVLAIAEKRGNRLYIEGEEMEP